MVDIIFASMKVIILIIFYHTLSSAFRDKNQIDIFECCDDDMLGLILQQFFKKILLNC